MHKTILFFFAFHLVIASAIAGDAADPNIDWKPWRYLPVQDEGRQKPFDTLARESVRTVTNRAGILDPETGQYFDATALYLTMLFEWEGWDRPSAPHPLADMDHTAAYVQSHTPDKWDNAPLLFVDSKELRKALGLAEDQKYVSPAELKKLEFRDPRSNASTPIFEWADKLNRVDRKELSPIEKKGLDLAEHYVSFVMYRTGQRLDILPIPEDSHQEWASLAGIVQSDYDDKTDPDGKLRNIKNCFQKARAAYLHKEDRAFNETSIAFLDAVMVLGRERGSYPTPEKIGLEVAYNQLALFSIAWILMSIATVIVVSNKFVNWTPTYVLSLLVYSAGLVAMFGGFGMRSIIAARAPITNMYESVLSVGVGIALLGLICELIYRKRYHLIAASILSALVLILAESSPSICNPSIRPLMPVLRSNLLLSIHVVPIMTSYAAFAVIWLLADVSLGISLVGPAGKDYMNSLSKLTLRIMRIGVFLLAVGTILGGVWADYSWGRFWGWDSKEVWALITLLCYLMVLHARYVGWIADFGMMIWSVVSFVVVIMTWYGVNFMLNTGMHSYGAGSEGGDFYVKAALAVQGLYLLAVTIVKYAREDAVESAAR